MVYTSQGVTISTDTTNRDCSWLVVNGCSVRIVGVGQLKFIIESLQRIAAELEPKRETTTKGWYCDICGKSLYGIEPCPNCIGMVGHG